MPDRRTAHKWQFKARFRRHAFGWRSQLPVKRVKEAVSEIRKVARSDKLLAAEGGGNVPREGVSGAGTR